MKRENLALYISRAVLKCTSHIPFSFSKFPHSLTSKHFLRYCALRNKCLHWWKLTCLSLESIETLSPYIKNICLKGIFKWQLENGLTKLFLPNDRVCICVWVRESVLRGKKREHVCKRDIYLKRRIKSMLEGFFCHTLVMHNRTFYLFIPVSLSTYLIWSSYQVFLKVSSHSSMNGGKKSSKTVQGHSL